MMGGDKGGKRSRRMVRSKNKDSDESDEDYMLGEDEEFEESEDEYNLNFDGDDSEEIFGELEEEEEEFVEKNVKKVGMPKVKKNVPYQGRKKNGSGKLVKKRGASYRVVEEEDEEEEEEEVDDDDDDDYNFGDKKTHKVVKPRKRKRVSYREEYDDSDDDLDDMHSKRVVKPREKKRVSYKEDDDDFDAGHEEGSEDEKVKLGKRREQRRISYKYDNDEDYNSNAEKIHKDAKPRKKKRVLYREIDYDDTDNDFSDMQVKTGVKPREKKRVSYKEDDDSFGTTHEEGSEDEKVKKVGKRRVQRRISCRDDDDDDHDDFDVTQEKEFVNENVNKARKPREKRMVLYKEDTENGKVNKAAKRRKKEGVSYTEEDDDYDGMDGEDDDEEFRPDEIDGADDEDELPELKKKVRMPRLQEERINRGRKRKKNSKVLTKTSRRKTRKNHEPRSKRKTANDGDFVDTKPISEEKNKKAYRRGRKKRLTIDSDSDFVISGSSDYDFTISEEEREQIREANEFCRSLNASLRSSTSAKKLKEEKNMPAQRKRPARKGKEKVEDLKVEAGKQVCGICLTEEAKRTVRGTLNCCSHYFCFACIVEWSKVESRCPLCKQRFVTISKPARPNTGFDLRTVVIQIPERDQVYQPSEEELQGFLDPYENVICTECHHGGDDALMLLCDLCDSPAHTYCVGLGWEVPEGNWYCEGCRPTTLGSSNPQVLTPTPDNRTNINLSNGSSPVSNIRETFDLNEMYVPDTPMTQETSQVPSPRPSVGDVPLPSPGSGSGAFTVLERRRIQRQIHHLLNSRRRQMDHRTPEAPATVSGHGLFGFQVGQSRELAPQHVMTSVRMPNNLHFQGNLHHSTVPLVQNSDVSSARLTHMVAGHPSQTQPSTSTNVSYSGFSHNEVSGLNTRIGLGLGHQQLQPCSGRPNISSGASTSSYPFREVSPYNVEKHQVQSMVRSQLKSLSRDLELDYGAFKDIARSSTHTILAACGVEHRRSEVYSVQTRMICIHDERLENRQIGQAKGLCSSCFDLFVRNVVSEIMNTRIAVFSSSKVLRDG